MPPPIFIITGASGSGKSSITDSIIKRKSLPVVKFKTCTTRLKRPNERHGRDYWFLTRQEFERQIKGNNLYEWADVYGQYYGSSKIEMQRLLKGNKPILMLTNVQGAKTLKKALPQAITIYIDAPVSDLKRRLIKRGAEMNDMKKRLATIPKEAPYKEKADFVVKNKDGQLIQAVNIVVGIIRQTIAKT
ncbi:MAG: hypothetical protein ABII13_00335 [Patescibacteria group bacterium]|nr:hypothetical protein [Patescibacteria group bacterium]MBU2508816.1 hypothetical protein [Patescibacteria group bacterium]